jgi:hypothetical protein
MTSVVCLFQVRNNLTFQLLFTLFQDEARHLCEIEKASVVVSFFNIHLTHINFRVHEKQKHTWDICNLNLESLVQNILLKCLDSLV